ncbi:hypothetical protein N5V81_13925 [Escherichia coli]|nr:hypothetical protein [Escherichia coli]
MAALSLWKVSVREIFNQALGEDIWETVGLWISRFMEVAGFYMAELKGKFHEHGNDR